MEKKLFWPLSAALVMIGLPWLAVTFMKGDAGMAVCFLLFFALDPVFSLLCGAFAGRKISKRWYLPLLPAVFFLAGCWLFFARDEKLFLLYAAVYLGLGVLAMLCSALLERVKKH